MKYLCLDIGNVLFDQNMEPFIRALSIQMNISKADADHFLSIIQHKQDIGISSIRDEVSSHFGIKSEYILEDLMSAWAITVMPNRNSISFFGNLAKNPEVKIALLSNIGFEHRNQLIGKFGFSSVWTKSIKHFSCEVGARKPSLLYYKTFLDLYPEFKGAIYVDDLKENLDAGAAQGLIPHHFDLSTHGWGDTHTKLEVLEKLIFPEKEQNI